MNRMNMLKRYIFALVTMLMLPTATLDAGTITVDAVPTQIYDGVNAVEPTVNVYDDGTLLTVGVDYTVSYGDNNTEGVDAGSVTITGIGGYTSYSTTVTFAIVNEYFTVDGICYRATSSTTVSVGAKNHAVAIATTTTSVTIPATVTHVVATPFQVTGIDDGAFTGCTVLRYVDLCNITGYTPSTLERTITASPFYGVPKQALVYLNGTSVRGENYVYKVGVGDYRCDVFKVYDDISGSQTGFTETNGYQWAFENKYTFTAKSIANTRKLTAGRHYTTCLPYDLPLPATLKAYTLAGANTAGTLIGFKEVTGTLTKHTPYVLIPSVSGQLLSTTNAVVQDLMEGSGRTEMNPRAAGSFTLYGTMRYMDGTDADGKYIMQYNNGEPTWKVISGSSSYDGACILPMRAYINLPGGGARSYYGATFTDADGHTTAIDQLRVDEDTNSPVYDLQGRRVDSSLFTPRSSLRRSGLYINGGRKVFVGNER